ncbi:hypothetical protein [Marinimicrobium sp. ABcell2]|uniref:hypothetical protein n=1 Tax=Marinimicrobium sp. ABcell2 TaxID=3069751 RepID=UPI0027AE85A5|nr:hypothetical protein [Marinimicrobium sp. ABcell2]MDQ2076895.1 hypothetical protein [Marinimicrobium sp. ABcell2]
MRTALPNTIRSVSRLALCASLLLGPALAHADRFSSGTVRFSGSLSATSAFGDNYVQVGIGLGYYLADGLELGLDAGSWLGGERNIHELAPSLTYVFTHVRTVQPYIGALYRRTFIEGREDLSAYGGRAGVFLQQSPNWMVRAGVVAIRNHNCDDTLYGDCTEVYPEVSIGFYF